MRRALLCLLPTLVVVASLPLCGQSSPQSGGDFSLNPDAVKLPTNVIMVKGAWSSASDSATPDPESGAVADKVYRSEYFQLAYPIPAGWVQKYTGPPPSDTGYYVLAQLRPSDDPKSTIRGSVLVAAQDLFFTGAPARSPVDLINFAQGHLQSDYKVDRAPVAVTIAGHSFIRFDYSSPIAELHWHILATQIRCHVVEFVFTTRDTNLADTLIQQLNQLKLPAEASLAVGQGSGGADAPVCIKDYATNENITGKVDPVFTERRFNSVPVRLIIDREGRVKHIHFLSAFPDQAKAITDALLQWRFRPYLRNGQPVEVETGITFGRSRTAVEPSTGAVSE